MRGLRRGLDALYAAAAALAALCLCGILGVTLAQVAARWAGVPFPGATQYAGYLMAAASFLAFAHALNREAHIRVGLLITALGRHARWAELWCLAVASTAAIYLAWHALRTVYWSRRLGDVSQGQDMTPLWLAQAPVALGAVILAVAFVDNLATRLLTGDDNIAAGDAAGGE